ncbi:MAG: J domain-containing protein, partial [Deltaproteobacteria bacterium]
MDDIERHYEILGLKPGASLDKVKEAFRDLVKVWHPDRFAHDPRVQKKAEEKLKEINLAYQKLESFLSSHQAQQADESYQ